MLEPWGRCSVGRKWLEEVVPSLFPFEKKNMNFGGGG